MDSFIAIFNKILDEWIEKSKNKAPFDPFEQTKEFSRQYSFCVTTTFMQRSRIIVTLICMLLSSFRAFTANNHLKMKTRSVSATTTTVVASAKKIASKMKKNPTRKPKVAKQAVTKSTMTSKKGEEPWFHFFTKGDEEYTAYMTNEWGFEKVGRKMPEMFEIIYFSLRPTIFHLNCISHFITSPSSTTTITREEIKPFLKRFLSKAPNLVFLG